MPESGYTCASARRAAGPGRGCARPGSPLGSSGCRALLRTYPSADKRPFLSVPSLTSMIYDVVLLPGVRRSDAVTRMFFFRLFSLAGYCRIPSVVPHAAGGSLLRVVYMQKRVCVGPKLLSSLPRLPSVTRQFVVWVSVSLPGL